MDAKQHAKETKEYMKARQEHADEAALRDLRVHGEFSKVKYDPSTGTLKEEK